jgi:hypothetical protein
VRDEQFRNRSAFAKSIISETEGGFDSSRKALRRFPVNACEHAGQVVQAFSWRYTLSWV